MLFNHYIQILLYGHIIYTTFHACNNACCMHQYMMHATLHTKYATLQTTHDACTHTLHTTHVPHPTHVPPPSAQEYGDVNHYKVLARVAILNAKFKDAETLYLERNDIDEVINMYRFMHKWDEAIGIAEAKVTSAI